MAAFIAIFNASTMGKQDWDIARTPQRKHQRCCPVLELCIHICARFDTHESYQRI
jgi:hypothetical protein